MTKPTGVVKTPLPGGNDGVTWEDVTQWDEFIEREAGLVGWPVDRVRGHVLIESRGVPTAKQVNSQGDSFGLLQIVPYTKNPQAQGWEGWHKVVKQKAGLPANASKQQVINALYDPAVNIAVGMEVLESFYQQHGTLDKASSAFFTGRPDWGAGDTVNGTTGKQYQAAVNALIKEQVLQGDVIDRLYGNRPYDISAEYGQLVTWSCPGCYEYFRDYGLDTRHHWAYDVSAAAGDGAPLFAPFNGTVVCAGTGVGSGAWGTGCAAFDRDNNYGGVPAGTGHGRLELLHEDGNRSLIIGHALNSRVRAGDRVQAGDYIGQQGGMNGSHVHLEGRYQNGTRIGDPRVLFPSGEVDEQGGTTPAYASPNPVPQPTDFDVSIEVTVTRDGVPVLQRADLSAAQTMPPLKKGDTFNAVYQVLGNDHNIYWVTTRSNRVPVEGTTAPGWKGGGVVETGVDPQVVANLVEGARSEIDTRLREVIAELTAA